MFSFDKKRRVYKSRSLNIQDLLSRIITEVTGIYSESFENVIQECRYRTLSSQQFEYLIKQMFFSVVSQVLIKYVHTCHCLSLLNE